MPTNSSEKQPDPELFHVPRIPYCVPRNLRPAAPPVSPCLHQNKTGRLGSPLTLPIRLIRLGLLTFNNA